MSTHIKNILFKLLEYFRDKFSGRITHAMPFVGIFYHKVYSYLKPNFFRTEWGMLYLDSGDTLSLVRNNGVWESGVTRLFRRIVKTGDIVIDIGAHIGYYTTLAAKLVGPTGKVYSFEPEPKNFALLTKNVSCNGYKNVFLERKGVADIVGQKRFFLYGSAQNSFVDQNRFIGKGAHYAINVDITTLDDFFRDKPERINVIKMDIEGGEGLVLKKMQSILAKNKGIKIITEFLAPLLEVSSGMRPLDFLTRLVSLGFILYDINAATGEIIKMSPQEIYKKYPVDGTNIFCARR